MACLEAYVSSVLNRTLDGLEPLPGMSRFWDAKAGVSLAPPPALPGTTLRFHPHAPIILFSPGSFTNGPSVWFEVDVNRVSPCFHFTFLSFALMLAFRAVAVGLRVYQAFAVDRGASLRGGGLAGTGGAQLRLRLRQVWYRCCPTNPDTTKPISWAWDERWGPTLLRRNSSPSNAKIGLRFMWFPRKRHRRSCKIMVHVSLFWVISW